MHNWTIKNKENIKRCDAKRLNTLESSVVVVIFCDTTNIAYIKYKIHHSLYEHGWPSGLSDRLLFLGSVVWVQLRFTFFSFFYIILFFYCCFLDPMFTFINIKHFIATFNTCQNQRKGPLTLIVTISSIYQNFNKHFNKPILYAYWRPRNKLIFMKPKIWESQVKGLDGLW